MLFRSPERNIKIKSLCREAALKSIRRYLPEIDLETEKLLKISKKDAFRQYIAYHEGWGNYKNYKNKQKVILLAKKVQIQSDNYKDQLKGCRESLSRKKYIIF